MLAAGTTAPLESVTVPLMAPVPAVCALPDCRASCASNMTTTAKTYRLPRDVCFRKVGFRTSVDDIRHPRISLPTEIQGSKSRLGHQCRTPIQLPVNHPYEKSYVKH